MRPSSISRRHVCSPAPRNVSGAQPTVRPPIVGQVQQVGALFPVETERLLEVDVLAVPECGRADLGMGPRHREVADDFDFPMGQKRADRERLQPKGLCRGPGPVLVYIRAGNISDIGIARRQVRLADLPTTNQADPHNI